MKTNQRITNSPKFSHNHNSNRKNKLINKIKEKNERLLHKFHLWIRNPLKPNHFKEFLSIFLKTKPNSLRKSHKRMNSLKWRNSKWKKLKRQSEIWKENNQKSFGLWPKSKSQKTYKGKTKKSKNSKSTMPKWEISLLISLQIGKKKINRL